MKIIFIEPKSPGIHVFSRWAIPRLGTVILATILKKAGYEVKIYIEEIAKIIWEEVYSADLVGISTITSTAPRAYDFASRISSKGIPVVLGGPHPTALPEEALKFADFVIRGEGEEVILPLIKALQIGKGFENIKGLSYKLFGRIVHNSPSLSWCDLNKYPIPDFSLIENWRKDSIVPIQTSRGCPYNCKFCSVTQIFGRKLRHKNIERVVEEIGSQDSKLIFFVDDNFTADKNRTKALLRRIIKEKLNIEWSCQVRVDAAQDKELVNLMKKAGCSTVFIGMESINPQSLKDIRKNQTLDDIIVSIREFHLRKIRVHGMFVVGFETDDAKTVRKTVKFAIKEGIDSIQILILTPLPGTETYEELKSAGRLFEKDWSKYDGSYVLFESKKISSYRLQVEAMRATLKFYSWWQIIKNILKLDWWGTKIKVYGHYLSKKWQSQIKDTYLKILKSFSR